MQDLRDALRALRASPLITTVAVLSLALGIGANTAIFSLVDSLLLRSLPVREPSRLVTVQQADSPNNSWTNPLWEAIRDRATFFDGTLAFGSARFNLAEGGPIDEATGYWVNGTFFDVLGVPAIVGRTFTVDDDRRGGGPDGAVAVISEGFWRRRYGGALDAVGRTISLNRVPYTIVGVTPADFYGPSVGRQFDVIVPIGTEPLMRGAESVLDRRSTWWLTIMARLRQGQGEAAATAALSTIYPAVREATIPTDWRPQDRAQYLDQGLVVQPAATGTSFLRSRYQQPLTALMVVVGLVLLIACANIANLLLARAAARRHEISVRQAIGASPWRLARQMLAESLVLSGAGAALGLAFAFWGSRLLARQISTRTSVVFLDLSPDWRVLAFTAAVSILTALIFGTAPALRVTKVQPIEAMKEQGRGTSARGGRLAGALVAAQVALSLALVVAAGLFVRTFTTLANFDPGFQKDRVLVVNLATQPGDVAPDARAGLFDRIHRSVLAAPGVAQAAVSVLSPVSGSSSYTRIEFQDFPDLAERERGAYLNRVTPGYFATLGTPLLDGRDFDARDGPNGEPVAIVNQAFARTFFRDASPLGHLIRADGRPGEPAPWMRIVGVVGDAVYRSLREPPPPTMYRALLQTPSLGSGAVLTVRPTAGPPAALVRTIVAEVTSVNPRVTLTVLPLAEQVNASVNQERLVAMLSGFFGGLALLLAGLGLYGVTSQHVSRRRAELGIYLALGAPPAGILRMVLRGVGTLIGSGVLVGGIVTWWAARFAEALVFGLEPRDPPTFLAAAVTLALVGVVAGWVPAWRAARIDPAEVLRAE